MRKTVFKEIEVACLDRQCHFNISKDCLPQNLFGPFLNICPILKSQIVIIDSLTCKLLSVPTLAKDTSLSMSYLL